MYNVAMRRFGLAVAVFVCAASAHAQTITYDLAPSSGFDQELCLAPCLCPGGHERGPMVGSFDLTFVSSDPHFDNYRIDHLRLSADVGRTVYGIEGEGLYSIGTSVRPENRLQLLATVGGAGPFRFDSKFRPLVAMFPVIDVPSTAFPICKRTTLNIIASPSNHNCYADCERTTGHGTLDVFDFLCFQNAFVGQRDYACDCDTSTGHGVCDLFDFLCFQNAFVVGCP